MRAVVSVCCGAVVALAASASGVKAGDMCDQALAAVHAARPDQAAPACAEAPFGVVLAADATRARALTLLAQGGESRFKRHFGQDPGRYAIMDYDAADGIRGWGAALRSAGFHRTLPNLSQAAFARAITESVRRSVEANPQAAMMSAEMKEAAVAAALVSQRSKLTPFGLAETEATSVPHEIGHNWFIQAYWPQSGADAAGHYGGPGPDWLDELAAVLHENDQLTADRRRQFKAVYLQQPDRKVLPDVTAKELTDLRTYLSREHPANRGVRDALAKIRQASGGKRSADGVTVLTGAEASAVSKDGLIFYLQSRAFADFLMERTENPQVFAEIATADASGVGFARWLAKSSSKYKLAASVTALEKQWHVWLIRKHTSTKSMK